MWLRLFGLGLVALVVLFTFYYYYFSTFCIFGAFTFLSAVLVFNGGQLNGLVAFLVTMK